MCWDINHTLIYIFIFRANISLSFLSHSLSHLSLSCSLSLFSHSLSFLSLFSHSLSHSFPTLSRSLSFLPLSLTSLSPFSLSSLFLFFFFICLASGFSLLYSLSYHRRREDGRCSRDPDHTRNPGETRHPQPVWESHRLPPPARASGAQSICVQVFNRLLRCE